MQHSREERLAEFLRRLKAAPRATSFDEAYGQLREILNAVEDEMTDTPYNPDAWQTDGRLYPQQRDSIRDVPGYPSVQRFRSRGHNTFIGSNGSIEIAEVGTGVPPTARLFTKAGADGRTVWNQGKGDRA